MKILLLIASTLFTMNNLACQEKIEEEKNFENSIGIIKDTTQITINLGSKKFKAILFDNETAKAFKEILPLTISMSDLNGNEKYYDLANELPANPIKVDTIKSGDIMLWQSNTLVLFYKEFTTSYSYTKIGRIEDETGLEEAVGSGDIMISIIKN